MKRREDIMNATRDNQVSSSGETGSGKTTQIPNVPDLGLGEANSPATPSRA